MLDKIIQFSIKNKFIILLLTLVLIAWGSYSIKQLPLDALPDVTNNQVQIITTAPTLASQEVEQLITYPLEQSVKTIPKVIELRSISRFGLSVVTVVFKDDVDIYWAREQIFQRLKQAEENIPDYAGSPELAPISTGLGEIYQYDVYAKKGYEDKYDAIKLRTIQDWIIIPQLQGIEGVAEVSTWGGKLKQYEVAVNPNTLNSLGVTITEIFDALEKNNQNTGGAYIEKDQYAYFIRGVGMATGIKDLENVVVKNRNGAPVLVRDVATVREGIALRYGASTKDGKGEIVCGLALMLKGENSSAVVERVKEKMVQINKTLPEGVVAEAFIDRGKLVDNAIGTVTKNLLEGALIVIFVLILFLGNLRAGLIVASVIPLSMLFAVILMNYFGVSGNLMSLGAIDFGIIVDGAVIIVEATMHHLQKLKRQKDLTQSEMDSEVYKSASKIRNSAAFGEIIILIVYLPILALVGTEGKMFKPMAMTVGFAVIGAFILSLTYVPMMSAMFLSKNTEHKSNFSDRMMAWFEKIYTPFLEKALQIKKSVLVIALGLFALAVITFQNMGGEFIPTIEEGDLAINATIMTGSSLTQMVETTTKYEKILKAKFPEIKTIVTKIGSGEIPTDPMPIESGDLIIVLKDKSEWTSADNWEDLANLMKEEMEAIPGANIEISQPIQMRFNELMTGSRSDIAIKIFGDDLEVLDTKAKELISKINKIEGIGDLKADKVTGLPQITVKYDYNKIALYGLNITDVNKIIRSSFAGESAGKIYEESKRFDVVVRMDAANRSDITDVSNLFIPLPNGQQVPLSQVAAISYEQGPVQVSRENGKRRITVGLNVRGRDIKSVVEEIQQKLETNFKLPAGYYITYGGQFENLVEANKRLSIALPIALGLIMVLLFFTFNSVKQSLLIFTAIPLSAIGGVFALWLRGMPFSISAGIGFIALFGIAVLNGIVLISYFNQLKSEGITDPLQRVLMGTKTRLRPVLMTAAVASLGFMPMALSTSGGAEVQKPLATVVIGGLFSATLLTLIVLPILYLLFENGMKIRKFKKRQPFVTLWFLLISCVALSQNKQTVTLDQAITLAKKSNIDLKIADKEIEKQTTLKKAAFQVDPLQVQYQGGQFNSVDYDHNVSVQQYFPIGKITKANRQLQEELAKLAEKRKALSEYEIEKAVTLAYYQYLYGVSIQKLNNELSDIYIKFLKNAELRFQTGESGNIEVISAKAKVKEIETQKLQLEYDLAVYQKQLQYFIQTDENIVPDAATPLKYEKNVSIAEDKVQGLVNDYYTQQISVYQKEANIFKAMRTPKLGLGYFGQTIDTKSYFQGFTAGLQIPLFGGVNSARAKASEISVVQAQLELDKSKLALKLQKEELKSEFDKQNKAMLYYQNEGLQYADQIITTAQKSYANGDMSYWSYISFLNQAIDIKKQNAEAVNAYNQSAIQLQFPSFSNN
ncbi:MULTISPECIES: CusA/CzcA family heavy metal efflux RND transporter [Flavobacterium]|uniref:Cobalt-zinc-cadmium resistance protein CzcA n=3 Tax=Flavobacterium TaxID=237 RepID=A0A1M6H6M8_9FLAO|nr:MULTISPECIES: CusA/CzcA family heavy metal efflux RND transporter [Flavobacterium]ESU19077.1 putative multidrug resistance protein [Flavobacterium cauense R2A-7]ESU28495.1 putative multidrug resistance protein [Flavobacterium limnosediminis JC2902]KGO82294.1 heat-shock protein Hsp70 [Flavobacterium cauense R2A-7]TWI15256.1 cobalt-zinc-cadmium resistance protein CzcA [Flavobacterium cauense R2A-7]UOK41453.1 CusA/CzcA family heavy metal efflux RND transporter [Flavobacterium enshiense]